jgi:hypothetical protein
MLPILISCSTCKTLIFQDANFKQQSTKISKPLWVLLPPLVMASTLASYRAQSNKNEHQAQRPKNGTFHHE